MSGLRHRTPALWNPLVAPRPDVPVEIDWEHPLAQGLQAFYLPGNSPRDIARKFPALSPASPNQAGPVPTVAGMGWSSVAVASGDINTVYGLTTTAPLPPIDFSRGATIWSRRIALGAALGFGTGIVALAPNITASAAVMLFAYAYGVYVISYIGGGALYSSSPVPVGVASQGITWVPGGAETNYTAGKADSLVYQQSTPTDLGYDPATGIFYLAQGGNEITLAGGLWNRTLTPQEMDWLDAEPYAMLRTAFKPLRGPYTAPVTNTASGAVLLPGVRASGNVGGGTNTAAGGGASSSSASGTATEINQASGAGEDGITATGTAGQITQSQATHRLAAPYRVRELSGPAKVLKVAASHRVRTLLAPPRT